MTLPDFLTQWHSASPTIEVHTSGSTGAPKHMLVEKSRMLASAKITCDFLHLKPGDTALLCMPLDFIAGKMMVVRSIERDLRLLCVTPSNHPLSDASLSAEKGTHITFAAMVPSQVFSSLQVPEESERLRSIDHLIIGGGAIPPDLEDELRTFPNHVWSTYGMTETLSHIALRPINGQQASAWYTPFDSVQLSLANEGQLVINAPLVCPTTLITNDIVELAPDSRFRIIGRTDNVICSGGIKLHIEEIETLLRPHLTVPYCITKRPDPKFGEVAVLLIAEEEISLCTDNKVLSDSDLTSLLRSVLPSYSVPKAIIRVPSIPITANGKIDRAAAISIACES